IDTTGSMGAAIGQAQSQASSLVTAVAAAIGDARFAVVDFKDFPCDGTSAYQVRQSMTANTTDIATAINAMSATGGCDAPEAYNTVFHNSSTEPGATEIGWRTGTRKFVIVIGDAEPHGAGTDGFTGCTDATVDEAGLGTASTLAEMNSAGRTLFMVKASGGSSSLQCYQSLAAAAYTGSAGANLGDDLSTQIVSLIGSASSTVSNVHMEVATASAGASASWVSFTPAAYDGSFTTPRDFPFAVHVAVPSCTPAGDYTFDLVGLADSGDVGHDALTVHVTPGAGCGALTIAKTADSDTVSGDEVAGYTITIANGTSSDVTFSHIQDYIHAHGRVSYVRGSTTGVTTADPNIRRGSLLTWKGPFTVTAGHSISLHFSIVAKLSKGCFFDEAKALVGKIRVLDTGLTAKVCVVDDDSTKPHHGKKHHHHHHRWGK
ncbi:MAG: hypothetical protein QOE87_3287, partial [Gaiellales bacterium]|nr:hypothetical protein [Gaiellales bacterium]